MQRKVFFGIGAYYRSGNTTAMKIAAHMFNGDKPGAANEFTVDLTQSPQNVDSDGAHMWDTIEVDDRGWNHKQEAIVVKAGAEPTGATVTTVGDGAPNTQKEGAVFLAVDVFKHNINAILASPGAKWPPAGFEEYELATVAYSDDEDENPDKAGMRFVGCRAHVLDQRGTLTKVLLHLAANNEWRGPVWLDLADVEDCDTPGGDPLDPDDPLHKYTFAGNGKTQGALFVRMERLARTMDPATVPRGPKLPIGHGG